MAAKSAAVYNLLIYKYVFCTIDVGAYVKDLLRKQVCSFSKIAGVGSLGCRGHNIGLEGL